MLCGRQSKYCSACREHFQARHLELDHIIVKSKGGTDHIGNLQLLCGNCTTERATAVQTELMLDTYTYIRTQTRS